MKTGVISVIDILGWKGIYNHLENPILILEEVVKTVKDLKNDNRTFSLPYADCNEFNEKENSEIIAIAESYQAKSSCQILSDTIVIITECEREKFSNAIYIHGGLLVAIFKKCFEKKLPIRGATSCGEMLKSKTYSIYIGKAIDEVMEAHQSVDWIGCHLTQSANKVYTQKHTQKHTQNWLKNNVSMPWKEKTNFKPFVLSLSLDIRNDPDSDFIKMMNHYIPMTNSAFSKYQNTLDYWSQYHKEQIEECGFKKTRKLIKPTQHKGPQHEQYYN